MEIVIDIQNANNKTAVLEIFSNTIFGGYGKNWNAFNDCMRYLDEGGIDGKAPLFQFPLKICIKNYKLFEQNDPESFAILKEIMKDQELEWKSEGKELTVFYE